MKKYSYMYFMWSLVFIVFPLILVLVYSFNSSSGMSLANFSPTFDNFRRVFEPLYIKIFLVSILLAIGSTLLCIVVGYPVAYYISRMSDKWRNSLMLLFVVPMWMNFLLRTYAWLTLLGNNGLINKFLGLFGIAPLNLMYNINAIMLGMVYNFLPFMVLPIYSTLVKMDKSLIEAAKDLGATNAQIFKKVIFPLSLPGVYTGITMVFIPAISTFVIPDLLGGNRFYLIGNLIEKQFTFTGDWAFGSAISIVLILIMFVIMVLQNLFEDNTEEGGIK
ncbi:ABC transporter, permease protein [Peptoniphilus duerdenii ATCC BAA-1640]|uniref:ABC transporter, permease protein n=1 Tax=Peptoniphilus duerdenii ATCC BAA-1640 TaxID=862517 RepID=E0NMN8_9FIRM|nr:ABC transporter permease [Peptoniphilus duerdenii]EFM24856.1 ABC transporter, permease protein [Peptoniphilus duerdenii ATCC BAA-1640]